MSMSGWLILGIVFFALGFGSMLARFRDIIYGPLMFIGAMIVVIDLVVTYVTRIPSIH